tara:strand:+ start:1325 stop:3037 length:1713 start_codon:yes stop_codon:yes gene_type:complete
MADNREFLKFHNLVKEWNTMKTASYKLSDTEINDFKKIIYDYTVEFNKNIPKGLDVTGGEKWMEGLLKKANLNNIDKTNAKEVAKLRSYIKNAINTVKGEDYAENITDKRGVIDSKLEDIFENWSFNEKAILNNAGLKQEGEITSDLNKALRASPFSKYFTGKGETPDYSNKKYLTEALISVNPELKKEYISTGDLDIDKAVDKIASAPSINEAAPNSDITLEEITKRFQGGDKTNPLDVDAINALDNINAINLIIDNKLPLTDEARGTLDGYLKYSPEEYRSNFRSIYFKEEDALVDPDVPVEIHEEGYTPEEVATEEVATEEVVAEEVATEEVVAETPVTEEGTLLTKGEQLIKGGTSLLKGAGKVLDYIGGPGAIVSYIMGKKGLKEAMKEVQPQASAELSPMFMQHLRQTRELAKKGFHPDEARKVRKGIDNAYQKGLDDAVRGTAGDRAKYLAQSGILDAKRSSALLDFAAEDATLQRKNADQYEKIMMFKENFDITQTEKERTEDMEKQLANKKAATEFTSAAFSNVISGLGRSNSSSAIMDQIMKTYTSGTGGTNLFNTIDKE